jgi:small-conductance mechanosensitive channel/CRP-like cAMP-binding protein
MRHWQDTLLYRFNSVEGVAVAAAIALLIFATFALPRQDRKELRVPAVLLVIYAVLEILHQGLPATVAIRGSLGKISLLVLLVALTRVSFLIVVDWFLGRRLGQPMPRIFRDILQGLMFFGIALILFRVMGVELGSLLTTSAILTAVIGLSLQESLGNLVAGLAVRAEHPFEIGDWVEIGDNARTIGKVVQINWRATKFRTNDLVDIVIPNGFIAKSTIQNFSRPSSTARRLVPFQGPYDVPPERIFEAVLSALRGCPGVALEPLPRVWLSGFGDSGVNYQVVYFLTDFSTRDAIDSSVRTRIWYAFNRANINIPFPVRDVRVQQVPVSVPQNQLDIPLPARLTLFDSIALFETIPSPLVEQLALAAIPVLYASTESIVVKGDPGHDLFIVVEGEVTVLSHSAEGERITLANLSRGDVFGELSLVTGVRGATVVAATQSVLLRLSLDDFRRIVSQVPELGEQLLTVIVERQGQLGRPESMGLDPTMANGAVKNALFDRIRRFFAS